MKTHLRELLAVLALIFLVSAGYAGEYRTWTSRKGTSVEARFDRVTGDFIVLQKTDGRFVKIEYSALSDTDQVHLRGGSQPKQGSMTASRSARQVAPSRLAQPALPRNKWNHQAAPQQEIVIPQQQPGVRWQDRDDDLAPQELNHGNLHNGNGLLDPDPWGQDQGVHFQQPNIQNQQRQNFANPMQGANQQNQWRANQQPQSDPMADWRKQQAEQERWAKQQEQDSIRREKQDLESEAWRLESRIRNAEHDSRPDYSGLSWKANQLSQDADRLGEHGASWQFQRAASSLREAEREQSSWNTHTSTFGSREDEKREEAQQNVWGGRGSINTFDSGNSFNNGSGSSFGTGTSMDSW